MSQSMTYDQSREMMLDKKLSHNTGIEVYFCEPYRPWQSGFNENMDGLLRQYLKNETFLSVYSQEKLDDLADQINNRLAKVWVLFHH